MPQRRLLRDLGGLLCQLLLDSIGGLMIGCGPMRQLGEPCLDSLLF